jgi:hypothetical protein
MVKRLLFGLLFGLIVGALLTAAVVKGLGMVAFTGMEGRILAYVFAGVTGVLVGLVAGKPIWASGGQIEAGLKAVVGAAVAMGAMAAMRQWLNIDIDLHALGGIGPDKAEAAGMMPATTLPLIAAVLGAFYEADNTPEPGDKAPKSKGKEPPNKSKVRVAKANGEDDEEEAEAPKKAKNGKAAQH